MTLPKSVEKPPRYATLAEAAKYLGSTERFIRNLISSGRLTGYRLGRKFIRINLDELDGTMEIIPTAANQ